MPRPQQRKNGTMSRGKAGIESLRPIEPDGRIEQAQLFRYGDDIAVMLATQSGTWCCLWNEVDALDFAAGIQEALQMERPVVLGGKGRDRGRDSHAGRAP